MKVFKNYRDEECFLTNEQENHIQARHPEATPQLISECLMMPLEIRKSSSRSEAQLYYIFKTADRYFCVVLKCCLDSKYISTAYTTSKIKSGQLIYKRGD
jgi:hypothetical protein